MPSRQEKDEAYRRGVSHGQDHESFPFAFGLDDMLRESFCEYWDDELQEIYEKGYEFGRANKPHVESLDAGVSENEDEPQSDEAEEENNEYYSSSGSGSARSGGGAVIAIILLIGVAIAWTCLTSSSPTRRSANPSVTGSPPSPIREAPIPRSPPTNRINQIPKYVSRPAELRPMPTIPETKAPTPRSLQEVAPVGSSSTNRYVTAVGNDAVDGLDRFTNKVGNQFDQFLNTKMRLSSRHEQVKDNNGLRNNVSAQPNNVKLEINNCKDLVVGTWSFDRLEFTRQYAMASWELERKRPDPVPWNTWLELHNSEHSSLRKVNITSRIEVRVDGTYLILDHKIEINDEGTPVKLEHKRQIHGTWHGSENQVTFSAPSKKAVLTYQHPYILLCYDLPNFGKFSIPHKQTRDLP